MSIEEQYERWLSARSIRGAVVLRNEMERDPITGFKIARRCRFVVDGAFPVDFATFGSSGWDRT